MMSLLNAIPIGIYVYVAAYMINYNYRILEQSRDSINTC